MFDEIFEFAKSVGQVGPEEEDVLFRLCQAAECELTGKLKDGVSPEGCRGAFVIAAAWMALAGLCVSRQDGESITAWSAGDVSIKGRMSAGEQAAVYTGQAQRLMAPYCVDDDFAFLGVKG